ncbi:hypothetical protein HMPREF0322_04998 [Desulfitobacterium hafniense DP7]|uniref:Uncharacterized protein n=1 Tax=Desulfitobacterium hafniense DP7 TaxID=537010 RepID=G9XVI5_DESHA|nr:hypothetical protein HMPREF0322_04998 [Desulfitobacterium hafniense DP7]
MAGVKSKILETTSYKVTAQSSKIFRANCRKTTLYRELSHSRDVHNNHVPLRLKMDEESHISNRKIQRRT